MSLRNARNGDGHRQIDPVKSAETQLVSNNSNSNGSDEAKKFLNIKAFVLYALWRLGGIGTTSEVLSHLEELGRPISKPHFTRISKELEDKHLVIRLRVKELSEYIKELTEETRKYSATSKSTGNTSANIMDKMNRIHRIIETHDTKSVVLILNMKNRETLELIRKAERLIEQEKRRIKKRKETVKEIIKDLLNLGTTPDLTFNQLNTSD